MGSSEILDMARRAGGIVSASELTKGGARWEDLYRERSSSFRAASIVSPTSRRRRIWISWRCVGGCLTA